MHNQFIFIKKTLKNKGFLDIQIKKGYQYFSGFFTSKSGQIYYISYSEGQKDFLIRTAKSYKDYSGGINYFYTVSKIMNLENYIK